jgi:hypothetical protein
MVSRCDKHESVSSNPSPTKKKEGKKERKEGRKKGRKEGRQKDSGL